MSSGQVDFSSENVRRNVLAVAARVGGSDC